MYKLDAKRVATMRSKLGAKASSLIKDDKYLPMFRNRQINYPKEFEESVEQATRKRNAGRWLASVWATANVAKTLKMLGQYIARKVAAMAAKRHAAGLQRAKAATYAGYTEQQRQENLRKLGELKAKFNLFARA